MVHGLVLAEVRRLVVWQRGIDFESKGGEVTVIARKKEKMPKVEFDLKAIKKIKNRKKKVSKASRERR